MSKMLSKVDLQEYIFRYFVSVFGGVQYIVYYNTISCFRRKYLNNNSVSFEKCFVLLTSDKNSFINQLLANLPLCCWTMRSGLAI